METENNPMNPMELPAQIRVNVLLNEMLNMVEHMTQLKEMIDHTMSELAGNTPHVHDNDCCDDPDCSSKEEE